MIVALLLCYASVTRSLAEIIKRSDPAKAHAWAPGNGRITALLAERLLVENMDRPTSGVQSKIANLAILALRQNAIAVPAVATLGFQAQLRGESASARRLFALSQRLSRRHLQTQLWAVEDAVARGDVAGALRHYDIALRTSKTAPDLLFPVLLAAIDDPAIRAGLTVTMKRRPLWAADFVTYAAVARNDPQSTALLFAKLRRAGVQIPASETARVIDRLLEAGASDDAWRYYTLLHPGSDPRRSRDPTFTGNARWPSQFEWKPSEDGSISTSIQRNGSTSLFDFSVPVGEGGPLLRQIQVLPPGAYQLQGQSSGIEQVDEARPYWTLTCLDGRELGRVVVPNSSQAKGQFSGRFDVPQGCGVQQLTLVARPSDETFGVTGQIARVQLMSVRQSGK